jgi:hypothetical protein
MTLRVRLPRSEGGAQDGAAPKSDCSIHSVGEQSEEIFGSNGALNDMYDTQHFASL